MKLTALILIHFCLIQAGFSQTLFAPSGSIGTSSNNGVGVGTSAPGSKLHVNGDNLSLWISRATYLSSGSEVGIDFRQLTHNGAFRTGGAIKSISSNSYTGGDGQTYDSHLVLYSTGNGILVEGLRIDDNGNIGVGSANAFGYKLAVNGTIGAKEVKVENTSPWPDFVFENGYELRTLEEVERYVIDNKHLPDIPSQTEVTESGIKLGEINAKLLLKIEELTLYMIDLNRRVGDLELANTELKDRNLELQKEISSSGYK